MSDVDPYGARAAVDVRPQCWRCGRTLAAYLSRPWSMRCRRCKAPNAAGEPPEGVMVAGSSAA